MTLLQEIQAACTPAEIASRDHALIAAKVSAGRTRVRSYPAGKGDVIVTLGLAVGNALCDLIDNAPDFRHVKHLLAEGRLDVSLPLAQMMLRALVGQQIATGITLTQAHADALKALAVEPDPVSPVQVAAALDGSL